MSDVEKSTEDIERNKKGGRNTKNEELVEAAGSDFEGHKKGVRTANEELSDDSGADFEGHKKGGRNT